MKLVTLFFSFLIFCSCAVSQPSGETDTKNKKARETFMKALDQLNIGETDMALQLVQQALDKDENYIDALFLKADILKTLRRYNESQAVYDRIIVLKPNLAPVYLYMGEMQFAAQQYALALKSIEKFTASGKMDNYEKEKVDKLLPNLRFAIEAVKKPVPFTPVNMGPNINSPASEYLPGLTADEQTFIFTRRDGRLPQEDFYISKWNGKEWSKATNLGPPVNTPGNEGCVSISTDGQFIFFAACAREDGAGSCDLYFSKLSGTSWSKPKNLGPVVNTSAWESQPSLSFDGLSLYFSSTRPGGYGGSDIWMTRFDNNKFQPPVNLGPDINTPGNEDCPFIHPDDQTLYFSSTGWPGMGGYDFFISRRNDEGKWGQPVNMGYPINTAADEKSLMVSRSGKLAYFATNTQEGLGEVDIYSFELYPDARPQVLSYVKATVSDAVTGAKLSAKAELIDLETGRKVIATSTNNITGEFLVVLKANANYALNVSSEGYLFHSENFSLKNSTRDEPFLIEVKLHKIEPGSVVVLKNTFFDTDLFTLKKESMSEMDKVVEFLNKNTTVKMEVSGHTDNTGNKQKNLVLSQNRAKAVYDYLVGKGIAPERLTYKGYGDQKPMADNTTEDGRQQNRRTELTITGK